MLGKQGKYNCIWYFIYFLPMTIFILGPAIYILLLDPLWQWNHPLHIPAWHPGFNERIQKTNYLATRRPAIDSLIIGSSRSAYIAPQFLDYKNGFNYSVSSGMVKDYNEYINYTCKRSKLKINNILLELSFFQALNYEDSFEKPSWYINNGEDRKLRFSMLFSRDAYAKCKNVLWKDLKQYVPGAAEYFVKYNCFQTYRGGEKNYASAAAKEQEILRQAKQTLDNKIYDINYGKYLKTINRSIDKMNKIIYIPPLTNTYLLYEVLLANRLDDYFNFIRDSVNNCEKVFVFAYPNKLAADINNFQDAHHPTIKFSKFLMHMVKNPETGSEFIINKNNLDSSLIMIKQRFELLYLNFINDRYVKLRDSLLRLESNAYVFNHPEVHNLGHQGLAKILSAEALYYKLTESESSKQNIILITEYLLNNSYKDKFGQIGWGLPQPWDAFSDGTTNSAQTSYAITVAEVVNAFMDTLQVNVLNKETRYKVTKTIKDVSLNWSCHYWNNKDNRCGFYWYSDSPNDVIETFNTTSMLAGAFARILSKCPKIYTTDEYAIVHTCIKKSVISLERAQRKSRGFPEWPYSTLPNQITNYDHDAVHHTFTLKGLQYCNRLLQKGNVKTISPSENILEKQALLFWNDKTKSFHRFIDEQQNDAPRLYDIEILQITKSPVVSTKILNYFLIKFNMIDTITGVVQFAVKQKPPYPVYYRV